MHVKHGRLLFSTIRAIRLAVSLSITWSIYLQLLLIVIHSYSLEYTSIQMGFLSVPSLSTVNAFFFIGCMLGFSSIPGIITYYIVKFR